MSLPTRSCDRHQHGGATGSSGERDRLRALRDIESIST